MKTCPKCKIEKPLDGFGKNKSKKDGLQNQCKSCRKEHYEQNKAVALAYRKDYYKQNKEAELLRIKDYYQQNKVEIAAYQKEYREQNKDGIAASQREYREQNKDGIAAYHREYRKIRYNGDTLYKLTRNIRRSVNRSLQNKGYTKKSKTHQILGCSFKQLEEHLNDNPYGFTIDMDGLDIDHIIPLSTAQSEEHLLELNHYTNTQLLPSDYNRNVKRDNEWDKEDFEKWYISERAIERY